MGPCPSRRRSRVDGWTGKEGPPSRPNSRQGPKCDIFSPCLTLCPPLSPSSLCPPAPVCILPLHHPVALFLSLLVTVCRPSPGLSFSSTPPRSFANFDFETKRRFLSLIDISPRARISSRPSTDRSPNQASKPARLTQPSTDYSSQRPCHPIINHRPANPSPTRQTHISISCNARLDCPLSSCLCVCVCVCKHVKELP